MRFRVVRTTDSFRNQPEKPCENAMLVEDEPKKSNNRGAKYYYPPGTIGRLFDLPQERLIKVHHWEIEISSLEELMDLVKEVGEPIIVTGTELEIYDGYRE